MANYYNATAGQQRPSGAVVNVSITNGAAAAGDASIIVSNPGNFKTKSQLRAVLLELVDQVAAGAGLK